MANVLRLTHNDIMNVSTEKTAVIGQRAETVDGRIYRYARATGAISAGQGVKKLELKKEGRNVDALKVGDTMVTISGQNLDANTQKLMEDALLTIDGQIYNTDGVSKNGTVNIVGGSLVAAAPNTKQLSLVNNQFNGVTGEAATANSLGIAETAVPAYSYFWARVSM